MTHYVLLFQDDRTLVRRTQEILGLILANICYRESAARYRLPRRAPQNEWRSSAGIQSSLQPTQNVFTSFFKKTLPLTNLEKINAGVPNPSVSSLLIKYRKQGWAARISSFAVLSLPYLLLAAKCGPKHF